MERSGPQVFIVDDDASIRSALRRLTTIAGFDALFFASAEEFLDVVKPAEHACLVLDVRLPGLDGLELQERLDELGIDIPIVFITGHGDVPMSVKALKRGAVDFLQKPFDAEDFIAAIHVALDRSRTESDNQSYNRSVRQRLKTLSRREHEVFDLVTSGLLNKQVADRLGISEKTVKVHRARVMAKMEVKSFAELARMAERLQQLQDR